MRWKSFAANAHRRLKVVLVIPGLPELSMLWEVITLFLTRARRFT